MNDKCAAGTGRFIEVMAKALNVELDRIGELSLATRRT
jgi:activator of 2-hydroxyglutaryl-CoA dehydratase